jgi:hypothetical protein
MVWQLEQVAIVPTCFGWGSPVQAPRSSDSANDVHSLVSERAEQARDCRRCPASDEPAAVDPRRGYCTV